GMSDAAIRVHLERLVTMEYVRCVTGRNGSRFEYELLFDGDLGASAPQMVGLIDIDALRAGSVDTTTTSQGAVPDLAPRLQAACTHPAPASQSAGSAENAGVAATSSTVIPEELKNAPRPLAALDDRSGIRSPFASAPSSNSFPLAAVASSGA